MMSIDWSTAPEGSDFYAGGRFWRTSNKGLGYKTSSGWILSNIPFLELKANQDYQPRPQQWPTESRIDVIGQQGNDGLHYDAVNHPKHYQIGAGIEAIDIIESSMSKEQFSGYLLGNFLKYRLRAGDKGDLQQDIDKSNWYRERLNAL